MEELHGKLDATDLRLTNGEKRRDKDERGRFVKGCKGGPGNPLVKRQAQIRHAIAEAVTREDIREIALRLIEDAKSPNFRIRHPSRVELFNRIFGRRGVILPDEQTANGAVNLAVILADPRMLEQVNRLALQLASSSTDNPAGHNRSVVSQGVDQDTPHGQVREKLGGAGICP